MSLPVIAKGAPQQSKKHYLWLLAILCVGFGQEQFV